MTKLEAVKVLLNNRENVNYMLNEMDLMLDNNYGAEVQELYSLVSIDKEDLGDSYRELKRTDITTLKAFIITTALEITKNLFDYEYSMEVSTATIKKAMKEINFYTWFNEEFVNGLQGETVNVEKLRKALVK